MVEDDLGADVSIFIASDSALKKNFRDLRDLVVQANGIQYSDAGFKSEMGQLVADARGSSLTRFPCRKRD